MARTIAEIQQSILDEIAADEVLNAETTSTSRTALFRLLARIVAFCAWTVEVLFDTLKTETNEIVATLKPHRLTWYAGKALDFQYGHTLPLDADVYDNTALTEDQVDESKIVKYAAVTDGADDRRLRVKVAKESGGDLAPLSGAEKTAFTAYMNLVKDAGVKLTIDSNAADQLKLSLKIYFDPLILNSDGQRIDGTADTPVLDAVKAFLKNQPFNGLFVLAYLVDHLQKVEGVVIPHIVSCETKYAALPFTSVDVMYLPDAGYLRLADDADLTLEYVAQNKLL